MSSPVRGKIKLNFTSWGIKLKYDLGEFMIMTTYIDYIFRVLERLKICKRVEFNGSMGLIEAKGSAIITFCVPEGMIEIARILEPKSNGNFRWIWIGDKEKYQIKRQKFIKIKPIREYTKIIAENENLKPKEAEFKEISYYISLNTYHALMKILKILKIAYNILNFLITIDTMEKMLSRLTKHQHSS